MSAQPLQISKSVHILLILVSYYFRERDVKERKEERRGRGREGIESKGLKLLELIAPAL